MFCSQIQLLENVLTRQAGHGGAHLQPQLLGSWGRRTTSAEPARKLIKTCLKGNREGLRVWLRDTAFAQHAQGPRFYTQYQKQNKKMY